MRNAIGDSIRVGYEVTACRDDRIGYRVLRAPCQGAYVSALTTRPVQRRSLIAAIRHVGTGYDAAPSRYGYDAPRA